MVDGDSTQTDFCEKASLETLILPCAKLLIFRKCCKLFSKKVDLRRLSECSKDLEIAKLHKQSNLRKNVFSQMFLYQ